MIDHATLLLVDDDDALRTALGRLLAAEGFVCLEASNISDAAARLADRDDIALVLLDVTMPGGSGVDLLRTMSADFPQVAVVMLTGIDDPELAQLAFDLGAYGYLIKPFGPNEIVIAIKGALVRRRLERTRAQQMLAQERTLTRARRVQEVITGLGARDRAPDDDVIERLSRALSLRDEETGRHIARMSRFTVTIAEEAGFCDLAPHDLSAAAALHDIGNIGVPDSVLLKPGRLAPDEQTAMQQHALIGYQLLADGQTDVLRAAAAIALTHHEWWDGSGYPRGLAGTEIPEASRIAAVADVFDALTSDRIHRPGVSIDHALDAMELLRGRQFEPRLLDAMLGCLDKLLAIRDDVPDRAGERRIRVLVVDDHELMVQGLTRLLETQPDIKVVGTAGSVREAHRAAAAYDPDVILMDFHLPDGDGIDATSLIKAARPETKVVMLTGRDDEDALLRAVSAGCAGFITKSDMVDRVVSAVRSAHLGDEVTPPSALLPTLQGLRPTNRGLGDALRPREVQVLELLAAGLSDPDIALALGLTVGTLRQHVADVLTALRAHSRLEAVATAIREGVIDVQRLVAR